jgi:WD40 repeat protein
MVAFGGTDQTILAAGYSGKRNSGGVVLWDIATGERLGPPLPVPEGWVSSVEISPDSATLAAVYGSPLKGGNPILWDLKSRKRLPDLARPASQGDAIDLAFSPDGKVMAVVVDYTEGTWSAGGVFLYDLKTGRPMGKQMSAAEGGLSCAIFSPDSKILATGYKGGSEGVPSGVILWDVASRERLGPPLRLTDGEPFTVEFRADGKMLALGHTGGVSRFDMDVGSWIEKAQRIANRNFTADEWARYYPDEAYHRTIRSLPWPSDLPENERKQAEALEQEQPEGKESP